MTGQTMADGAPACGNEDHRYRVRAVARTSWPDGRFKPGTACKGCLDRVIRSYVTGDEDEARHPLLIVPAGATPPVPEVVSARVHRAISDPGAFVPREPEESVTHWGARAVMAAISEWPGAVPAAEPGVAQVRAWLRRSGWEERAAGKAGALWSGPGGGSVGILHDDGDPAFTRQAVRRIARIEGRPAAEVAAEMAAMQGGSGE